MDTSLTAPLISPDPSTAIAGRSEGAQRRLGRNAGTVAGHPVADIHDDRGSGIGVASQAPQRRIRQLSGPVNANGAAGPAVPVNGVLTIILVEDEALIRINTADMLEDMGHTVIEAATAAQALAAAEARDFDILVTDIGLPDMSGGDLANEVRRLKPTAGIIFATGESELPDGAGAGAVLLVKPYSGDSLKRALDRVR